MGKYIAAFLFASAPALVAGAIGALFGGPAIGALLYLLALGFGLDVLLRPTSPLDR